MTSGFVAWQTSRGRDCLLMEEPLQFYRRHDSNVSQSEMSWAGKPIRFSIGRWFGLQDVRAGLVRQRRFLEASSRRVRDRAGVLDGLGLGGPLGPALARLDERCKAFAGRERLMTYPRLQRMPHLVRFAMRGQYRHFDGGKSGLKDLLRP